MKRIQRLLACIVVVLTFVQTPLVYAVDLATPSATPEMSREPEATPSMVLDQLEASASASPSAVIDIPTPSPTLEMLTGPSGVLTPSASVKLPPHIRPMTKRAFRAGDVASVVVENVDMSALRVTMKNTTGEVMTGAPSLEPYDGGIRVTFIPKTSSKPGKYTIVVEDTTTGVTTTQDFLWGVLAFNTDAATYNPGDTAAIALAVLDEEGKMVCNADVTLTILSPARNITTRKTADGTIRVTPACSVHDYTLIPDYETSFRTSDEGIYQVLLTATTKNGTYAIQDSFQVSSDMPFGVKRDSATRIYPPKPYPMTIDVTANEDFRGTVTETVPENFTITALPGAVPYTDVKTIVPIPESQTPIQLGMPFDGNYPVTLGFGDRIKDPQIKSLYEQNGLQGHDGADFAMPVGTVVLAVDSGTVSRIADNPYGTTVVIDHSWGRSYYGHVSVVQVKEGDTVTKGAPIALSGNTGLTTGAHLHFGMKLSKNDMGNGYYGKIDPMPYLTSSVVYQADGSGKQISWNVNIKTGEKIRLGYTYKAPEVSPQFYLVGPLTFRSDTGAAPGAAPMPDSPFVLGVATDSAKPSISVSNSITYQEPRRWQLAADAVAYRGGYNDGGAANPTSGTWSLTGTNAVAGDFAICVWYSRASTKTITPTGPTLITNNDQNTANGGHIWVGYKVITAADITAGNVGTWTASSVTNGTTGSSVAVFSGVDTSAAITHYATATAGGIGDPNPPSISTTSGNTLITIFGEMDQNDGVTAPTDFTLATNAGWSTTSGTDGSSNVAYYLTGGTGSSYDPAVFTTTTDNYWYATTLEITHEDSPTVSLTTPTDTQTISDTTPDLVFTGTDANSDEIEYNVQVDTSSGFNSQTTYPMYSNDSSLTIYSGTNLYNGGTNYAGEYFVSTYDGKITSSKFYFGKNANPTGTATAELYLSSGTPDVNALPTGSVLATSDSLNVSTITGTLASPQLIELTFTGAQQYQMVAGAQYFILVHYSGGDLTNRISISLGNNGSTGLSGMNPIYSTDGVGWTGQTSWEYNFYVYQTYSVPLLDKVSTTDTGFSGTGDPHPWPSGNAVTHTANVLKEFSIGGQSSAGYYGSNWVGQTFTVGSNYNIVAVDLELYRFGSPGTCTVGIYATSGGVPTGSALTSGSIDGNSLPTVGGTYTRIGLTPYSLTNGNVYAIVTSINGDESNYIFSRSNTDVYANGSVVSSTDSGGSWTALTTLDLNFKVLSEFSSGTYYWRVRGLDPSGTNTWGAWSSPTWSFTVSAGSSGPTLDQLMRHGKWFNGSGVRQGFTF